MKRNKKDKLESEKVKIKNRLEMLSRITKKLYEDYACNSLDSESYHKMLGEYQHKQKRV